MERARGDAAFCKKRISTNRGIKFLPWKSWLSVESVALFLRAARGRPHAQVLYTYALGFFLCINVSARCTRIEIYRAIVLVMGHGSTWVVHFPASPYQRGCLDKHNKIEQLYSILTLPAGASKSAHTRSPDVIRDRLAIACLHSRACNSPAWDDDFTWKFFFYSNVMSEWPRIPAFHEQLLVLIRTHK